MAKTVTEVMDTQTLSILLTTIESKINVAIQKAEEIRRSSQEVQLLDDIKQNTLLEEYAVCVKDYETISYSLSEMSNISMDLRALKRKMNTVKGSMPASIDMQFRTRMEMIGKDVYDTQENLKYVKDAFDAKLKFYNSAQFMLSGGQYLSKF